MNNNIGHDIPANLIEDMGLTLHEDGGAPKDTRPIITKVLESNKVVDSIEEAVRRSGLRDGMTISFHHHFRGGDYVVNMVMEVIAKMGIKDLKVAASSLQDCHAPMIEHVKNGVVTKIETSGMRGKLAEAVSRGLMDYPVIFRSHGGRAAAIASGDLHIDVAFLGACSCDAAGNASGYYTNPDGKSMCGSLGYAMVDARYADKVVVLTDNMVPFPNTPRAIPDTDVDYIVEVGEVGNSAKIGAGATRYTTNPKDLLIAQQAAKVVMNSGHFHDGFSMQTGSGGAALAVTRFLEDEMREQGIQASFGLGGITGQMVRLHEQGLIRKLLDVQSFDADAAKSLRDNHDHAQISAVEYASPFNEGSAIHHLDVVILSALEVDVNFNVNVLTGSDGIIRGAVGGHPDTASGASLTVLVTPVIRGRIPCVVDRVGCLITEGRVCDVLVTDAGIAVNPNRPEVEAQLKKAGLNVRTIQELKAHAESVVGAPNPLQYEDKVVAVVTHPDGSVLDVIRQIKED